MPIFGRGRGQSPEQGAARAAALVRSGLARLRAGAYEQAVRDLQQALLLDPDMTSAYDHLAVAYYHLGRLDDALTSVEQAIQWAPADAALRRTHGTVLEGMGRLSEAASAYNAAAGLDPDDKRTLVALSALALKLHDPRAAERCLEAAIARDPADVDLLIKLADLREEQGMLAGAIETLQRVAALNRRNPSVYHRIGGLLERMGDLEAAQVAYRTAHDLAPSNAGYLAAMRGVLARAEQAARSTSQTTAPGRDSVAAGVDPFGASARLTRPEPSVPLAQPVVARMPDDAARTPDTYAVGNETGERSLVVDRGEGVVAMPSEPRSNPRATISPDRWSHIAPPSPGVVAPPDGEAISASARPAIRPTNPSPVPTPGADERGRTAQPEAAPAPSLPAQASIVPPVAAREGHAGSRSAVSSSIQPRSVEEYEAAVAINPGNAKFHHELSILYLRAGRLADAKREAKMAEQSRGRRAGG